MDELSQITDFGLDWLDASGGFADIVLSTRVRIARNLQGHAFGPRARVNDREAVLRQIRLAAEKIPTPQFADGDPIRNVRFDVDLTGLPALPQEEAAALLAFSAPVGGAEETAAP